MREMKRKMMKRKNKIRKEKEEIKRVKKVNNEEPKIQDGKTQDKTLDRTLEVAIKQMHLQIFHEHLCYLIIFI